MSEPIGPPMRYHGGKWRLARWIIAHMPKHRVYTESYGGGASVLLRKPRSMVEVYNELDGEVVNLFEVLRDPAAAARLAELLWLTPCARIEFERSYEPTDDRIESARRLVVRSFLGFGSNSHASTPSGRSMTGFRGHASGSDALPSREWASLPERLRLITERLRRVVIECRDALDVLSHHDAVDTLHYVDPPYLPETRSLANPYCVKHMYRHELDGGGHAKLLERLRGLAGMVVLSGYPSALYDDALNGWRRIEKPTYADGARPRIEVLWLNPACAWALDAEASARMAAQAKTHAGEGTPLFGAAP